ncbi:uncharacterized protein [Ptychodera flava]|uniref:uncharacterized protein n=1 Tax=Ptychodera flava TaxID=63121 RepID=UPI00396AAC51
MRELAERFNIPLKLKATYDQQQFDAIDQSFCKLGSKNSPNGSKDFEEMGSDSKSVTIAITVTTIDDGTKKGEDALAASRPTVGHERSPSGSTHFEETESVGKSFAQGESSRTRSIDPEQSKHPSAKAELRVASDVPDLYDASTKGPSAEKEEIKKAFGHPDSSIEVSDDEEGSIRNKNRRHPLNMQRRDKVSALIVNENWGSASRDGIPSINRMIASVLSDIEINEIYSTVVRYNANDKEEAKMFNVKFKKAEPKERRFDNILRSGLVPNRDYLYLHDYFYPNLRELESDVKLVFSYSLATAEEARKLKQDIFHDAALFFINIWHPDTISPEILSCDQTELSKRDDELQEQFIAGSHIVSVGKGTHEHFKPDHRRGQSSTHYYVQPIFIHGKNLPNRYKALDTKTTFEIVSILQPRDCTHSPEIIRQVLTDVARTYEREFRIVWKIIGDFSGKEEIIEENFTPSGVKLRIKVCSSLKQIVDALLGCHLLLSHAKTHITDPSISLALSLGVPLLIPDNLDFEHLIDKYLVNYKNDLLVKIDDKHDICTQLEVKIGSYLNAVAKAREISDHISQRDLAKESCSELRKGIEMLLDHISPVSVATQVAESTADEHILEEESSTLSSRKPTGNAGPPRTAHTEETEHVDELGEIISVSCDVAYGIPETGHEMAETEKQLFDPREQSEAHGATRQAVEDLESDIEVSDAEEGSIRYNIRCTKSEALRGVWRHYQSGTGQETSTKMLDRENEEERLTEVVDGKCNETQGLTSSKRKLSEAEVFVLEAMNEQLSQENKSLQDLFAKKEQENASSSVKDGSHDSSDGEYFIAFASEGSSPGQLRRPYGIDIDKNDNVYVCEYKSERIVQFSAEGEFLQNIGKGQVSPKYIAVNKDDDPLRVAVSDGKRHCIKVFL